MLWCTGSYANGPHVPGECAGACRVQRRPFRVHVSERNVVSLSPAWVAPPNRTTSRLVPSYAIAGLQRGLGASTCLRWLAAKTGAGRRTSGNPDRSNAAADAWRKSRRVSILSASIPRYRRTASKRCVIRSASVSVNVQEARPHTPAKRIADGTPKRFLSGVADQDPLGLVAPDQLYAPGDSGQLEISVDGHQFSRPADSGSPGGRTGFFFR